jgi:hypothetical protein
MAMLVRSPSFRTGVKEVGSSSFLVRQRGTSGLGAQMPAGDLSDGLLGSVNPARRRERRSGLRRSRPSTPCPCRSSAVQAPDCLARHSI